MHQPRHLHPPRSPIPPNRLRALQQVSHLTQLRVRIRLVHQRVQLLHGFPDGEVKLGTGAVAVSGEEVVGYGLVGMLEGVESLDGGGWGGGVFAEGVWGRRR